MKKSTKVIDKPGGPFSPAGESEQHAAPLSAPVAVEYDPFAGILPTADDLAKLRQQAALARRREFNEKMPHVLRRIAEEVRQAAARGEVQTIVELEPHHVEWANKHQQALLGYLSGFFLAASAMSGTERGFSIRLKWGADQ